nr:hypothetical protein [Tanacetum cinerariifolium]
MISMSGTTRNQATVQDDRVVVQNVQGYPNRGYGINPRGGNAAGYGGAPNGVRNDNQGQARSGQARTAEENKVALDAEQLLFLAVDPLALLLNVSNPQRYSPSSSALSSTQVPPPLAESSSPVEDLIKNLTNMPALLTQSYITFLPQTNNQLQTSSNARNQATVQDDRVVVQNVQGYPNRGYGINPRGGNAAGYGGAPNGVRNDNQGQARSGQARTAEENKVALDAEQLLFLAGGQDNVFDDDE